MSKVSSREFQQNVGYYQDLAIAEPVEITKHGRDHVVILSAREYERLKRLDRQPLYAWEVPEDVVTAIEKAEVPPGHEHLDAELDS
ncbi:MAG: type II toxin-antitoxin system prevent-host-death family antitoxin [Alphaproteobacteria bacterium]|nr:type II toxin-antitoxin system prevent-host-death family antitoxin [Alphaproteobacteria bacterium]